MHAATVHAQTRIVGGVNSEQNALTQSKCMTPSSLPELVKGLGAALSIVLATVFPLKSGRDLHSPAMQHCRSLNVQRSSLPLIHCKVKTSTTKSDGNLASQGAVLDAGVHASCIGAYMVALAVVLALHGDTHVS